MNKINTYADKLNLCRTFNCTMEQLNQQYAANAVQWKTMYEKALTISPKKYRGYTAEQLKERHEHFLKLSTLTQ